MDDKNNEALCHAINDLRNRIRVIEEELSDQQALQKHPTVTVTKAYLDTLESDTADYDELYLKNVAQEAIIDEQSKEIEEWKKRHSTIMHSGRALTDLSRKRYDIIKGLRKQLREKHSVTELNLQAAENDRAVYHTALREIYELSDTRHEVHAATILDRIYDITSTLLGSTPPDDEEPRH